MRIHLLIIVYFLVSFDTLSFFGVDYANTGLGTCFAQDDRMTVGIQLKPLFRNEFFNSGNVDAIEDDVNFSVTPDLGFVGGMIVRKDFGKRFSLETGINYVKRNYSLLVSDLDSSFSGQLKFGIIEYEIPVSVLIYVQLGDRFYMNNSIGLGINMFKRSVIFQEDHIKASFARSTWIIPGLISNVGWEYRTENSGSFYLGGSYQMPISRILTMMVDYYASNTIISTDYKLSLSYFTFDFKYFFPENKY